MLFTIVWRRRYVAAVILALGLTFGSVQAWPLVRNVFDENQPHFGELAQVEITGEWRLWRMMEGASMTVHPPVDGVYPVDFHSGGCLDQWEAKRTGRYTDGALTLNGPVKEYSGLTYRRLYSIRIAGKDYLVPDTRLGEFRRSLTRQDEIKRDVGMAFASFSRQQRSRLHHLESHDTR